MTLEVIADENLGVCEGEVADQRGVWVFLHPLDIQGSGGLSPKKVDSLAEEEVVVLEAVSDYYHR